MHYKNGYNNFTRNSKELESAHISVKRRKDKLAYNELLLNKKKEPTTRCCMNLKTMLSERSPTQGEHTTQILLHGIL